MVSGHLSDDRRDRPRRVVSRVASSRVASRRVARVVFHALFVIGLVMPRSRRVASSRARVCGATGSRAPPRRRCRVGKQSDVAVGRVLAPRAGVISNSISKSTSRVAGADRRAARDTDARDGDGDDDDDGARDAVAMARARDDANEREGEREGERGGGRAVRDARRERVQGGRARGDKEGGQGIVPEGVL
jgi:hypothetical protein